MARIEFWGGVGVIGSSKVLIHDGGHRVLLDLGLDIPRGSDLFRSPAALPRGRELSARLRVGAAPAMAGLYDPAALDPGDPLGEPAEPAAVFISHPHIDHVGLAGFLRADIPAYASPDAIALLRALDHGGETLPGPRDFSSAETSWRRMPAGAAVQVGPIRVERLDVDHDVPGASGYRVTTSDGVLAFTGDIGSTAITRSDRGPSPMPSPAAMSWSPRAPRSASTSTSRRGPRRTWPATPRRPSTAAPT
ncbi:MAG TPA: MBL fold metallo-hydrolase [Streptosporangiaceae bacterium]